jgi:uncharacterized membrane protein
MARRRLFTAKHLNDLKAELSTDSNPKLTSVIERNIAIIELLRVQAENQRTPQDKFADAMTKFSGGMVFLYLHVVWFGAWIVLNVNLIPGIKAFDPFPFGFLTMAVSLEAIFLSTFVLISQNRQSILDEHRESLDLQIDLLAEYEITRMLGLVDKIAQKLGIDDPNQVEIAQLCEPVVPEVVMREIERREHHS